MANVLVVEDEAFTIAVLTHILKRLGHTIVVANNGKDGIAHAKSGKPDLIVMDMSMPEMMGWDAIRALKADAETRAIPILALTSANTAEDRDEAYEAGCDGFEAKPIEVERFEERIKEMLG